MYYLFRCRLEPKLALVMWYNTFCLLLMDLRYRSYFVYNPPFLAKSSFRTKGKQVLQTFSVFSCLSSTNRAIVYQSNIIVNLKSYVWKKTTSVKLCQAHCLVLPIGFNSLLRVLSTVWRLQNVAPTSFRVVIYFGPPEILGLALFARLTICLKTTFIFVLNIIFSLAWLSHIDRYLVGWSPQTHKIVSWSERIEHSLVKWTDQKLCREVNGSKKVSWSKRIENSVMKWKGRK